jgi:hypothetical protein
LAPGKPLRLAFESGKPHSMILWGPPGTGKTTLARIMSTDFNSEFIALSAVLSGIKDIRNAIEQAQLVLQQTGRHTILFVDEVHRFNKSQQDAFLPYVEQGLITFVGATTENPSFEVNNALLSRAQVYVLSALSEQELTQLFERAQKLALGNLQFSQEAQHTLIEFAMVMRGVCSTCWSKSEMRLKPKPLHPSAKHMCSTRYRAMHAILTKAAMRFMTRYPPCTNLFAAPPPTQRSIGYAACWMAGLMHSTSDVAWFAWRLRILVWPILAPCV